jgi:hypothetical protein
VHSCQHNSAGGDVGQHLASLPTQSNLARHLVRGLCQLVARQVLVCGAELALDMMRHANHALRQGLASGRARQRILELEQQHRNLLLQVAHSG